MAKGLALAPFAAGITFALAYFMNGLMRKDTGAAGFALAAKKGVSNIKVDEDAAPKIGMWPKCGTNAGKSNGGIIGANFGNAN